MRIRQARQSDIAAAAQVWFERIALLRETDPNLALEQDAVRAWRERAGRWVASKDFGFFAAEVGGEIIGILVVGIRDNPPWLLPKQIGIIFEMVVDLHQAHPGLSGALLAQAKVWLNARDVDVLEIQSPAHYAVEEAFWRAQGGKLRSHSFWLRL